MRRQSCQTPCCSGFSCEGSLYLLPLPPSLTAASFPPPLHAAARGERQPRRVRSRAATTSCQLRVLSLHNSHVQTETRQTFSKPKSHTFNHNRFHARRWTLLIFFPFPCVLMLPPAAPSTYPLKKNPEEDAPKAASHDKSPHTHHPFANNQKIKRDKTEKEKRRKKASYR